MTTTTNTIAPPDQSDRATELIELWLLLDVEAQDEALARLIAAAVHDGVGSALERFAATGCLDGQRALEEINEARVPVSREPWLDCRGRHNLTRGGGRS
ncbi:hypothetical protein [Mesorhizobium japonicum]|uniref:hypothetical protein n=1 Tax=Mesorhizobium japonicum TaxID=2066070 RepID=UPI003B5ACE0C